MIADKVNVRAEPGTTSTVVGTLSRGETVRETGRAILNGQHWYRVTLEGEVPVVAEMAGRVLKVEVHEGDRVNVGDVVARFDASEALAQVRALRAEYEQARAQVDATASELMRVRKQVQAGTMTRGEADAARKAATEARVRLTQLRDRVEKLRERQDRARIVATEPGTVAEVRVEPGTRIRAGEPAVILRREAVSGYVFGPLLAEPAKAAPPRPARVETEPAPQPPAASEAPRPARVESEVTVQELMKLHERPNPAARVVAVIAPRVRVTVSGPVEGTDWYEVSREGKVLGYTQGQVTGSPR